MTSPLIVDYYSDILCVSVWVAKRRNEELQEQVLHANVIGLSSHGSEEASWC